MSGSDERVLATALARLDDADLAAVLRRRGVAPESRWDDFFDAAEALLAPAAVDRALTALPRDLVAALQTLPAAPAAEASLIDAALLRPDGTAYTVVAERLAALAPDPVAPASGALAAAASDAQTALAAERAFTAVSSLTDVLLWTLSTPIARTGAGPVGVADRRRLVEAGAVADIELLEDVISLAAAAGLLRDVDRAWRATAAAERWVGSPTLERWARVTEAYLAALPEAIRTPSGGFAAPTEWTDAYPLDPAWPQAADALHRRARDWGLVADDGSVPPWSATIGEDGAPDLAALAPLLPTEIDKIYLQADLSAIAPGPLRPELEQRLRVMATRESRAQASTYRFSPDSLAAAVAAGETGSSLRAFLSELSLTGIPQPLDYLIERATARRGQLRVGTDAASGRTLVFADDADLLAAVAVDQALRPVGLVTDGDRLVSRATREAVYWALIEARYPAVAVDEAGEVHPLARQLAPDVPPPAADSERYATLLATLRGAQGPDAEAAWLLRELEQAVRARAIIEVTVRLPDGTTRAFVLEATGLGGGRLRGRDRMADVERTLPVSSIASSRPA